MDLFFNLRFFIRALSFSFTRASQSAPVPIAARLGQRARLLAVIAKLPDNEILPALSGRQCVQEADAPAVGKRYAQRYTEAIYTWRVTEPAGLLRLNFKGEILEIPDDFHARLRAARRVEVEINSLGGNGVAGLAMARYLRDKDSVGTVRGVAASAACLIFQGCRWRRMTASSHLMIHAPHSVIHANAAGLRHEAEQLDRIMYEDIALYILRTGQTAAVVESWFDGKDHLFDAGQSLKFNLVDEIIPEPEELPAPDHQDGTRHPDQWRLKRSRLRERDRTKASAMVNL